MAAAPSIWIMWLGTAGPASRLAGIAAAIPATRLRSRGGTRALPRGRRGADARATYSNATIRRMSDPQTVSTDASVAAFLAGIADGAKHADGEDLCRIMAAATGEPPAMWGAGIVGFGAHHYRYASGREGDTFLAGFAPRAKGLTLYLTGGLDGHDALLARLGSHTTGVGCVNIKRLADIDRDALAGLVRAAVASVRGGSI